MKKRDISLILVVVIISGFASFFISRWAFASTSKRQEKVEVVDAITTDFNLPEARYFNNQSINPTQLIQIGENANQTPFKDAN
jgi:hypothetical protein